MSGLLVVGMHRSGTSAVARVVHGLGLDTGGGDLMTPRADNARGFFERRDVVALDNCWLSRLGGAWDAPPRTSVADWDRLDGAQLRDDRESLDILSPDHRPWLVKDPRISLLVPLWDRLALRRLPLVLAVRDPLQSAASVWLRDGIPPRRALALWYVYVSQAASSLSDRSALVVDYGQLVARTDDTIDALSGFVRSVVRGTSAVPASTLTALVEPDLRRQDGSDVPRLPREYVDDARALHAVLAANHAQPKPAVSLPAIPDWVDETWGELRELHLLRRRIAELTAERDAAAPS